VAAPVQLAPPHASLWLSPPVSRSGLRRKTCLDSTPRAPLSPFSYSHLRQHQRRKPPLPCPRFARMAQPGTDRGLYPDQPFVVGPPWSSVVAYDLNCGTIKWKAPLGQDAKPAAEAAHDTGAFMAEHHGMIVTSTGLIFIAASDGKIRALDAETGGTLWTATLPRGSEGIPAMYQVRGRQYLVVSASSNINAGPGTPAAAGRRQCCGPICRRITYRSRCQGSRSPAPSS